MCGIVGMVGNLPSDLVQREVLRLLSHRGPDSSGRMRLACNGKDLWLGHTRLAILDLSDAGHQPMASRDGRWCVTFNGEIYNHLELRKELSGEWRGHSDTETLAEALAAWGLPNTVSRLNGMFAFAAVDMMDGKLYLARDSFGVKPLYYAKTKEGLGFSSEIRALAAVTESRYPIDAKSLQTFLSLRYVPSPHTLLAGVFRVPAGHYVCADIRHGQTTSHRFAEPEEQRFKGSLPDAVNRYHGLLQQAVRRQMLSDVPVGILLSGGIDSAFIAAIAAGLDAAPPCFTVGFGAQFPECELADAAETAKTLRLSMYSVLVTQDDLWEAFEPCIASIEEPLGTSSMLPMWQLSRRAREKVTVVLTGQGSDEPWGGYRRYRAELWRDFPLIPFLARVLAPVIRRHMHLPEHLMRALDAMPITDMRARFETEYRLFSAGQRSGLTGRSDYGRATEGIGYWLDSMPGGQRWNGAQAMMAIDSRMGLADDLLLYGDKVSMAHSLEARVPMLDRELVRFIESLPLSYRVSILQGKVAHKRAAEQYLPPHIVHRKKKNFSVPFSHWIKTSWHDRVEKLLFTDSSPHLTWLQSDGIRNIWNAHQEGRSDFGRHIFALLAFAIWCKTMQGSIAGTSAWDNALTMGGNDAYLV
jgi:asparagine synthase (glutamine-hydrolysing)